MGPLRRWVHLTLRLQLLNSVRILPPQRPKLRARTGGVKVSIVPNGVFYKLGITHIVNVSEVNVTKKWGISIPELLLLRGNPTPFNKQKLSSVKSITYKVRNALWLRTC